MVPTHVVTLKNVLDIGFQFMIAIKKTKQKSASRMLGLSLSNKELSCLCV